MDPGGVGLGVDSWWADRNWTDRSGWGFRRPAGTEQSRPVGGPSFPMGRVVSLLFFEERVGFLIWVGPPLANLRVGLFEKKTGLGLAAYVSNRAYILVRCRLLRAVVPLSARVD